MKKNPLILSDLTWQEAKKRAETVKTAIIPIGATEQHGPYMPIGTDALIAQSITDRLIEDLGEDYPVFFLPTLPLGKSPEHMDFFGTITIQPATLIALVDDICASLAKHGFQNVVFLNTHGGNVDLLKAILYDMRVKYDIFPYCIHMGGSDGWDGAGPQYFPELQLPECHAGSVEASLIAYFYPHLLPDGLRCTTGQRVDLPEYPFGWKTSDLSENGIIGDPQFYSAEAGERIAKDAVERVHSILDKILAFPGAAK